VRTFDKVHFGVDLLFTDEALDAPLFGLYDAIPLGQHEELQRNVGKGTV